MNRRTFPVISVIKSGFFVCLLAVCAACGGTPAPQAETAAPATPAPATMYTHAIVYAKPDSTLPAELIRSVAALYANGGIVDALHLENTQPPEKAGFSSALVLGFKDASALAAWRKSITSLLNPSVEVLLAERLFHAETAGRDSSVAVFQGNFMQPKVNRAGFADFSARYMKKYLELQRQEGILSAYAMYQAEGEHGLAFMMREHTNPDIFANRNPPKDRLRDELMARDADYRQLEDNAIEYRVHLSSTTARHVPLIR